MLATATEELEQRRLAYYKEGGSVRLTEAGCLGACSHGPTVAAYYGGTEGLKEAWYVGMDVPRLVRLAEALHAGEAPPDEQRFGPR